MPANITRNTKQFALFYIFNLLFQILVDSIGKYHTGHTKDILPNFQRHVIENKHFSQEKMGLNLPLKLTFVFQDFLQRL